VRNAEDVKLFGCGSPSINRTLPRVDVARRAEVNPMEGTVYVEVGGGQSRKYSKKEVSQ